MPAYDDVSEMHALAERVHLVADHLTVIDSPNTRCDDFDDLDRRMREISALVAHMVTAAARADRSLDGAIRCAAFTRYKIAALSQAARSLTQALAHLGEAVAQTGLLRRLDAEHRVGQHSAARQSAHEAIQDHVIRARHALNDGGYQLRLAADRLLASLPANAAWSEPTGPRPAPPTAPPTRTR